jgi:hypothetical protein
VGLPDRAGALHGHTGHEAVQVGDEGVQGVEPRHVAHPVDEEGVLGPAGREQFTTALPIRLVPGSDQCVHPVVQNRRQRLPGRLPGQHTEVVSPPAQVPLLELPVRQIRVPEGEERPAAQGLEIDGHRRCSLGQAVGAPGVPPREDDTPLRHRLHDRAPSRRGVVRIADDQSSALPGVQLAPRAHPAGEALRVGEVAIHHGRRGGDVKGEFNSVRRRHSPPPPQPGS